MTESLSPPSPRMALPILPRELTAISEVVRAVPPPPIPALAEPYAIRLADPAVDAAQISEWMNRPHLAEAWEYDWPEARWRDYLRAQVAGSYSRPLVGSLRGEDHGYVEVYRAAKDSIAPRYDADPYDLGMHAAIADLNIVNRGFGPILLPAAGQEPLRDRTAVPADHVRPRPPQHRGPATVRLCGLRLPRRARDGEPSDGAVRAAPSLAAGSSASIQSSERLSVSIQDSERRFRGPFFALRF